MMSLASAPVQFCLSRLDVTSVVSFNRNSLHRFGITVFVSDCNVSNFLLYGTDCLIRLVTPKQLRMIPHHVDYYSILICCDASRLGIAIHLTTLFGVSISALLAQELVPLLPNRKLKLGNSNILW